MKRRRFLLVLLVIFALGALCFSCRDFLLNKVFEYEQRHLLNKYGLQISVSRIRFSNLSQVQIEGLSVVPQGADTLVHIATVDFRLSIFKLLNGSIGIADLNISNVLVTAWRESGHNNLLFLNRADNNSPASASSASYKEQVESRATRLLRLLRIPITAQYINLIYHDSGSSADIYIPALQYDLKQLSATAVNRLQQDTFTIHALVLHRNDDYQFDVQHKGSDTSWLPFLNKPRGLKCAFQSISGTIKLESSGDNWQAHVRLQTNRLYLNHWRLSAQDVLLPETQFSGLFKISDDKLELDSASSLALGGTIFNLAARFQRGPDTLIAFSLHMPETVSDTFFADLPIGMFNTLKGISCSGTLTYDMDFSMHSSQPDSLIFVSALKRKDFHIVHYGNENLAHINGSFIYNAYQGHQFLRRILVGEGNPDYTPLDRINRYLPLCIMQSEDPGFMEHRGFIPEAMRESIAKDYRERRFARGGSTISMQLVKNVFLSRDKTVSRKLEEALLVYLIENLQLVSKQRMMEVYLNVIEWGPGIYGAGEASQFYFHKNPATLTLPECVFLAAIIPNPRSFRYQFDKTGNVKPYITDFYKLITSRLVNRGLVSGQDTTGINPAIKLSGPAARLVLPGDTIAIPEEDPTDME